MSNKVLKIALIVGLLATSAFGQTALTQTTLAAAINGPVMYNGTTTGANTDTTATLTSVTGVVAAVNGSVQSYLYVDQELMGVLLVNTTSKVVTLLRSQSSTKASPHANGSMVLIGQTGQPGLNAFFQQDPPIGGACTGSSTTSTPWINILTGAQFICSTQTNTWVTGFGIGQSQWSSALTASVASVAGTTTPSGPFFHVTGALAITAWGIPVGCNATTVGACNFCIIPDAAFTTTATNNIALATTAVINKVQCWTWDSKNSKFTVLQGS